MRVLSFYFLFTLFASSSTYALSSLVDTPAWEYHHDRRRRAQFSAQNFNLHDLKNLIKSHKINYISELLAHPDFPLEMKTNALRVNYSESIQCSTPEAPRIIMFMPEGELICSFNSGNPVDYTDHPLGENCLLTLNHLECFSHNKKGKPQIHSFAFKQEPKFQAYEPIPFDETLSERIGSVMYYKNPHRCTACHSGSQSEFSFDLPRLIYDSYFIWPNASGAINDNSHAQLENPDNLKQFILKKIPQKEIEADHLFFKNSQSHVRYKNLLQDYIYSPLLPLDHPENNFFRENPHLNLKLNRIQLTSNISRLILMMKELPQFDKFLPLASMISRNCFKNKNTSTPFPGLNLNSPSLIKSFLDDKNPVTSSLLCSAKEIAETLYEQNQDEMNRMIERLTENLGQEALIKGRLEFSYALSRKPLSLGEKLALKRLGPKSSFEGKNRTHMLLAYLAFMADGYPLESLSPTYSGNLVFSFGISSDETQFGGDIQKALQDFYTEMDKILFSKFTCDQLYKESQRRLDSLKFY